MRVSPRTAIWPQLVAISLIGLGVAGCADTTRFGDLFGSTSSIPSRSDAYNPGAQSASVSRVETSPLPHLANANPSPSDGAVGYASGAARPVPSAAYRSPVTAPVRSASVSPSSTARRGGLVAPAVVHVVRAGESMHSIAGIYHKPVTVIARANNLAVDAKLKP